MDSLLNKTNIWVAGIAGFLILNIIGWLLMEVTVKRAVDATIHKLEKEYSPSPYGPGLDPDRVNPDTYQPRTVYELRSEPVVKDWGSEWESERSAN